MLKEGGELMESPEARAKRLLEESRLAMDNVLRNLRDLREMKQRGPGGRELSEAITNFETGCMYMNRSEHAVDGEYSPLLKLEKKEVN